MNDDDIERRLTDAFAAHARASVGDHAPKPSLRLDGRVSMPRRHRPGRMLAPLAAAAVVAAVVGLTVGLNSSSSHGPSAAASSPHPTAARTNVTLVSDVHVRMGLSDGERVGVGMPVVAYFSQPVTDGRILQRLTSVTVNGRPVQADWYFAPNSGMPGYPTQAHLRMQSYWPAHATITVNAPVAGVSAGGGHAFAQDVAVHFTTGAATIATVDDSKHRMTVLQDGKEMGSFPVSLGEAATPTLAGIKVVMAKGLSVCMSGPGYNECGIRDTQRLTSTGEYLHSAPWNTYNIKAGIDSSNGCTNLMPSDAAVLYSMLEVGDVVDYPNADGGPMTLADGLGDWNVSWALWVQGGSAPTH